MTSKHVTCGRKLKWSVDLDGERKLHHGVLLAEHPSHDVALILFISDKLVTPVVLTGRRLVFGEETWVAGYPKAARLVVTPGLMSPPNASSSEVWFGNSGGAVIDFSGRVVGVLDSIMTGNWEGNLHPVSHVSYFVPIRNVAKWLRLHAIYL